MAERFGEQIYEDKLRQNKNYFGYTELMTEEQRKRGRYYAQAYSRRRAEVDSISDKLSWDEIERLYACDRISNSQDSSYPNSFIPLLTPTIEGQAAHMTSADTEFNFVSDNPAHEMYMSKLDAADSYMRRQGKFMLQMKDFIRSYLSLGGAWLTVEWTKAYGKNAGKPDGYARAKVIPIRDILVDGRIKDFKDVQDAEYIIHEIGFVPIIWARDEYGDEYADALMTHNSRYQGDMPDVSEDDSDSFLLLHIWTRANKQGNLQLIEMDEAGLILRESDSSKPYYEQVDNEYPFAFARGMPVPGSFYGYGDGKILLPMQKVVNNLCDELELACRFSSQSKLFVDSKAGLSDVSEIDSDPSRIVIASNPSQNIWQMQSKGINPAVQQMIDFLLREAQRATRFSDVMTGMKQAASTTATATQSQQIQGAVGISDKKADIMEVMKWARKYCIKLALEKWTAPFWARVGNNKSAEMVDMPMVSKVPASSLPSPETVLNFIAKNPTAPRANIPTYDLVEDDNGELVMADIDFDVDIAMGSDMPHGKSDMYNIVLSLMQMQVMENGVPKPFMSASKARELIERYVGIPLSDEDEETESENGGVMNQGVNPTSPNGAIQMPQGSQMPTPSALMNTTPGTGAVDRRGMAL
jgi:hypothetical protein